MKFTLVIMTFFAAVSATKLSREVYRRSLDDTDAYSSLEQMDHESEIAQAQEEAKMNQIHKAEEAKRRL